MATMDNKDVQHRLIVLQFNVSPAAGRQVSVAVRRFLIEQQVQEASVKLQPGPDLVALLDNANKYDADNLNTALARRRTKEHQVHLEAYPRKEYKGKVLLYNETTLTPVIQGDSVLTEKDFFTEPDHRDNAKRLFDRVRGGLFRHIASRQLVVAVAYHGEKPIKDAEKKQDARGNLPAENIIEGLM
jgi:hypothetical protein